MIRPRNEPPEDKLRRRSRTDAGNGCQVWTGSVDKDGYGKFTKKGWPDRAHRAAFIVANGPIPAGMIIRHTCDNPPCINPNHLILGTYLDNAADRVQRGRFDKNSRRFNPVRLSMQDARDIRAKRAAGALHRELAAEYGVGPDQISRVANHLNWKESA